ncbi:hypothetical protein EJ04DRAFT_544414 [Polyplosphaeria fusca]|uniref:DUF7730 domain-containing protein n=1 Tax=Polyplosphaeria fusca TaxID=682080 RepID=A0A9P4QXL7_9PLEO|nr:hypothetical protein EJ04DRAFT_544414 [Polyplosphaeria fusca]
MNKRARDERTASASPKRRKTSYNLRSSSLPVPENHRTNSPTVNRKRKHSTGTPEKSVFPFMKLPAELRLLVYHMALQSDMPLLLRFVHRPDYFDDDYAPRRETRTSSRAPPRPAFMRPDRTWAQELDTMAARQLGCRGPVNVALLRVSQTIYREARGVLYAGNEFDLHLDTAELALKAMHQRSRSLIKHVSLTIPSHHDILDAFADLVRLGLRYCWGLKSFRINLPSGFPLDNGSGTTSVYANAFRILRWLPKACKVEMVGEVNESIRRVAEEEGILRRDLDETSYLRRQHQMPERH